MRLQPVELDWMRDDEEELLLLPGGAVDCLDDSPVVVGAYFVFGSPAVCGDDLESFGLVFEVLEELFEDASF